MRRRWISRQKNLILHKVCLLLAAVAAAGTAGTVIRSMASFDESQAVHIRAGEIENATLIIGTHLIHISALNDQNFEIAEKSAGESIQEHRYYKSELADGAWFDITSAASLADITTAGVPVEAGVIERLFLRYHTKSDKITYDLLTKEAVNIHDLQPLYDLQSLDELEPLKVQYDILREKQEKTDSEKYAEMRVGEFLRMEFGDDYTDECDTRMDDLQSYYEQLAAGDVEASALQMVAKVMETVDADRRAHVMQKLADPYLAGLADDLAGIAEAEARPDVYEASAELMDGVGSSLERVQESYVDAEGKRLSEGNTILGKKTYQLSKQLSEDAGAGAVRSCDVDVERLVHIESISSGETVDRTGEAAYLESDLLPVADSEFIAGISGGAGTAYAASSEDGRISKAVLRQKLKAQKNDVNAVRLEMQFFIEALTDRLENAEARRLIGQRIQEADRMPDHIMQDDFSAFASSVITDYQLWLKEKQEELVKEGGGSELDQLAVQKKKYQDEKLAALDANDLAGAEKYDKLLAAVDEKMNALGGVDDTADALRDQALEAVKSGDGDRLDHCLEGLEAVMTANPGRGMGALEDIRYAVINAAGEASQGDSSVGDGENGPDGSTSPAAGGSAENSIGGRMQDMLSRVESMINENAGLLLDTLDENGIRTLLAVLLGAEMDTLDQRTQASALLAVHMYAEHTKKEDIAHLASSMAEKMYGQGNRYLYSQYKNRSAAYLPVDTIADCMNYRYVFNNNEKKAVLTKKGMHHVFYAFSNKVEIGGLETEEMKVAAGFQKTIYIEEEYAYPVFGCRAFYIIGSQYGLLATDEMVDTAEELLKNMLEAGGE